MRYTPATGLLIVATSIGFSQSSALSQPATPSFEVATIKASAPPVDGRIMIRRGGDPGRLDYANVTMLNLLTQAYKVKEPQIIGPDWISSARYDVTAKLPSGATRDQVPAMLQTLLAERFKLTIHKESKVLPAYALVPAKSGLKLKETEAPATGENRGNRMMMGPRGRHMTGKMTMQQLADLLSSWMDRPVIDKTDAKGVYEIDIEWSGDEGPREIRGMMGPGGPGGPGPGGPPPEGHREANESADAPSIFVALQEKLGLKLDSRKEPVDIIRIDQLEKVPSEN